MKFKHSEASAIFKALGDDNRLEIMTILAEGEKCGCHLLAALNIGQPTLSHHMRILRAAGLVKARKKGKWMHYTISPECSDRVRALIDRYIPKAEKTFRKSECCSK